ncbi:5-oxoprolinase subunit PxpB [Gracilibacillus kekensis]|uniref:Inhibitor of KinA n=1 Tax=Gracilibacillus kekensis TaxID=1027249 RepID=A0A1M7N191_9BACI|nr:5-oxoprolinase subunit PxpB [Gracilibacillus kekensis]SHM97317.1 inhibitor of KinA [Gracilibacillus kekensis]
MHLQSIAEHAILISFQDEKDLSSKLISYKKEITNHTNLPIIEVVIGYCTITIYFDPFKTTHQQLKMKLQERMKSFDVLKKEQGTVHQIPVCYEEIFGSDLSTLAAKHNFSIEEVIERHTRPIYRVAFLGFSPGFPFLMGMDQSLSTDRKDKPRLEVMEGSVGIAGAQTGIYPSSSPGGWNIIGRTPISLLSFRNNKPTLFQPGDQLKFYAIFKSEFDRIYQEERNTHVNRDY